MVVQINIVTRIGRYRWEYGIFSIWQTISRAIAVIAVAQPQQQLPVKKKFRCNRVIVRRLNRSKTFGRLRSARVFFEKTNSPDRRCLRVQPSQHHNGEKSAYIRCVRVFKTNDRCTERARGRKFWFRTHSFVCEAPLKIYDAKGGALCPHVRINLSPARFIVPKTV